MPCHSWPDFGQKCWFLAFVSKSLYSYVPNCRGGVTLPFLPKKFPKMALFWNKLLNKKKTKSFRGKTRSNSEITHQEEHFMPYLTPSVKNKIDLPPPLLLHPLLLEAGEEFVQPLPVVKSLYIRSENYSRSVYNEVSALERCPPYGMSASFIVAIFSKSR